MIYLKYKEQFDVKEVKSKAGASFGLLFMLNSLTLAKVLKEKPESLDIINTIEMDDGSFEELFPYQVSMTEEMIQRSHNVRPFSDKIVIDRAADTSNWKYGPNHAAQILLKVGRGSLTVQVRYDDEGHPMSFFVGTKRAMLKGMVNQQAWVPATDQDVHVLCSSYPFVFQHFYNDGQK